MAETGRPQQEENEMASISERRQSDDLYESILALKDLESCKRFFNDLCSPTERRAMEQRFEVARLLQAGTSYMDILEKTGASSATVSRAAGGHPQPHRRGAVSPAGLCPRPCEAALRRGGEASPSFRRGR